VIENEAAHDARGVAHEPVAIWKRCAAAFGDVEIRFVKECGDAEARRRSAPAQLAPCETMKFGIEGGEQCFVGQAVAMFRSRNQRRNGLRGHVLLLARHSDSLRIRTGPPQAVLCRSGSRQFAKQ
jgi:hypothetical protein